MKKPIQHEMGAFINALQLSIKTKIDSISSSSDGEAWIYFGSPPQSNDRKLFTFLKLFDGDWEKNKRIFKIYNADKINWPQITLFLLLTRMDDKNIAKLIQIDRSAKEIAEKLGMKYSKTNIENIENCSKIIFDKIKEKGMTNRELAESTGLTQVTISNFKSGKDIKLSNLIKIVQVLGLDLRII